MRQTASISVKEVEVTEKRLLVIDDEPGFARFVENVAADMGFAVTVTTDDRAFMQAYEDVSPAIIVLDMVMPGRDGNELILWLAERKCDASLVIITGYTPDYAKNARTLAEYKGFRSVETLYKPVEVEQLRDVLTRLPAA